MVKMIASLGLPHGNTVTLMVGLFLASNRKLCYFGRINLLHHIIWITLIDFY